MCTDTALKVSQFLYFFTSISHGVGSYFLRLWCMGISDNIFVLYFSIESLYFFYFQGEANGAALEIVAWVCLS